MQYANWINVCMYYLREDNKNPNERVYVFLGEKKNVRAARQSLGNQQNRNQKLFLLGKLS